MLRFTLHSKAQSLSQKFTTTTSRTLQILKVLGSLKACSIMFTMQSVRSCGFASIKSIECSTTTRNLHMSPSRLIPTTKNKILGCFNISKTSARQPISSRFPQQRSFHNTTSKATMFSSSARRVATRTVSRAFNSSAKPVAERKATPFLAAAGFAIGTSVLFANEQVCATFDNGL